MAHRFTVIEKEEEGGYHVFCPVLPGCQTQSETIEEGIQNIHETIQLYAETVTEDGLPIPTEDILNKPVRDSRVTPKVPAVKPKQLVRVAEHLRFEFRRQRGSHAIDVRPTDQARVVIPMPGGERKRKTLRAISRDLEITAEKFRELL